MNCDLIRTHLQLDFRCTTLCCRMIDWLTLHLYRFNVLLSLFMALSSLNFLTIGCDFSGLGYITGAGIANATGDWRWALRVRTLKLSVNANVSWALTVAEGQISSQFAAFTDHTHPGCRGTHLADPLMPQPTQRCCWNPGRGSCNAELLPRGRQVSSEKVRRGK